jgi:hypothetical protein
MRAVATMLAVAGLLNAAAARAQEQPSRAPVAALFRVAGFPTVDAPAIPRRVLDEATANLPVETITSLDDLRSRLQRDRYDVLVLPYGSAFPLDAWPELRSFVKSGGGLVVLGGAPFHQPVRRGPGSSWIPGMRQPTFAHEFLLGPAEQVKVDAKWKMVLPEKSWQHVTGGAKNVWELTVRLATRADLPWEHGSEGYRDALLRPLVHLTDVDGIPRACPLLEIDRLRGEEAGGRWIFAPSDASLSAPLIRRLIERALSGAATVDAGPVYASIESTETAAIRISVLRPGASAAAGRAEVIVRDHSGGQVHRTSAQLEAGEVTIEIRPEQALPPGLYRVEVNLPDASWEPRSTTTGFWVRDAALLASGPRITASRDWLRRNGEVFPVIGTTYMASDVHRKFLFEPDPHVWDRDFAQMAARGINFVRTGLWTAWSRAMLDPGPVDEAFLRALDAYVQSAARHGIVVNFTFFSFLPPSYGGTNPYLDPRSLEGQRAFLTAVARRYRDVGWIHYDLINEPSYAPPEGLWSNRPIRDEWERRAWVEWVRKRHGDDPLLLRSRWLDRGANPLELPRQDELSSTQIREDRRPRKTRDFVEFSQEVVSGWASGLRQILRDAGGEVLVTLGQDEGGTWQRPSQQLHAGAVDYTAVHPWWQNDDVLATGVFAKVPEKPNLFQETGLMRLEDLDGWPWRTPELAASVLESKYANAFAARAAGVVEWAWNINPYMPIDNESVIGFIRPDGTAKPELQVVPEFAQFFGAAASWLDDFDPDPVVIVIPHSRLFMGRPAATDGFRRAVRLLAERFGVVPTALSELRLTAERLRHARLVIVPSVEVLDPRAAEALLAASRAGTKVLVTGAVTGDPYGEQGPALQALGIVDRGRPVRLREESRWGAATFDRNLRESLFRSGAPALESFRGNVWHEPLPLEHAREDGPLAALFGAALEAAGVDTHPSDVGVAARLLYAPRSVLAVVVNETASDARRRVKVGGRVVEIPVAAGRSRLALFEREGGKLIVATPGAAIR